MNDYALINSLLEDGSPQAILKLKMIIDFSKIVRCSDTGEILKNIDKNKRLLFLEIFKDNFSTLFKKSYNDFRIWIAVWVDTSNVMEFIKLFEHDFGKLLQENVYMLSKYVSEKDQLEFIQFYRNIFEEEFSYCPSEIKYVNENLIFDVIKMFRSSFILGFNFKPYEIKCLPYNCRYEILKYLGLVVQ